MLPSTRKLFVIATASAGVGALTGWLLYKADAPKSVNARCIESNEQAVLCRTVFHRVIVSHVTGG